MYTYDDILILGDSFCMSQNSKDKNKLGLGWPEVLSRKLTNFSNGYCRGTGYGGCAWWSVRTELLKQLKISVPKILILCHTDANRFPSQYDTPLGSHTDESYIGKVASYYEYITEARIDRDMVKAIQLFYKKLWFPELMHWAQMQWYYELDKLLNEYSIEKVIHMHCFYNCKHEIYTFKNGITIKEVLLHIQLNNRNGHYNHFDIETNEIVSDRLFTLIQNYNDFEKGNQISIFDDLVKK